MLCSACKCGLNTILAPGKVYQLTQICSSPLLLFHSLQEGFRPAKYFSIDRVFRNEAIDRTHLAEFHQIEGGWVGGRAGGQAGRQRFP